jgi:DNA replication protein DnaC
MIETKNFFVDPQDVKELKTSIVGILCKGVCNGTGLLIVQGVFVDCICQKEYQNKVKFLVANIPKKYWDFTLRNLTKEFTEENKGALGILQQFREKIEMVTQEGIGLYMQGSVGLAKSALSFHILKNAINKDIVSYSIRMSQLTKLIFDSLRDPKAKDHLEYIKRDVRLLMIDEIEKDYKVGDLSQFQGIQVNDFFGAVYERRKSLIVTSNVPKTGLKGFQAGNVIDRLEELIDVVLTGASYRRSDTALNKLME